PLPHCLIPPYTPRRPHRTTLCPYTPLFRSFVRPFHLPDSFYFTLFHDIVAIVLHVHRIVLLLIRKHHGRSGKTLCSQGTENINQDRKSTRLNSSHVKSSYAVYCLKKKKTEL